VTALLAGPRLWRRAAAPGLVLRPFRPADAGTLLGHMLATLREAQPPAAPPPWRPAAMERWMQRQVAEGRHVGVLAERGGESLGSMGVLLAEGSGRWLLHAFVEPGHRDSGLARQLAAETAEAVLMLRLRRMMREGAAGLPPLGAMLGRRAAPQAMLRIGSSAPVAGKRTRFEA
jgi:GNAT superfamily N-acetyltransferase